jgi:UDP-glucose 4-epimerase
VPRLVGQALQSTPLTVYGDGTQTRCFCHVHDIVPALIELLETSAAYGEAVNLGNPTETSISDLAQMILQITGADSAIEFVSYRDAYGSGYEDMRRRIPDITKAADLIAFGPQRHLDRIVTDVADDLRARSPLERMRWNADRTEPVAALRTSGAGPPVGNGHRSAHFPPSLTNGAAR